MIRVLTLNIWQEQGDWARRMALIAERLGTVRPDVVCLQEVRQAGDRVPNQAADRTSTTGGCCRLSKQLSTHLTRATTPTSRIDHWG